MKLKFTLNLYTLNLYALGHDKLSIEDGNYSMILGKFAVQFEDKIPKLVLKYNSDRVLGLNISIDLALAFACPRYSPEKSLPLHVKCNEYYALAKISRFSERIYVFPISYSVYFNRSKHLGYL